MRRLKQPSYIFDYDSLPDDKPILYFYLQSKVDGVCAGCVYKDGRREYTSGESLKHIFARQGERNGKQK